MNKRERRAILDIAEDVRRESKCGCHFTSNKPYFFCRTCMRLREAATGNPHFMDLGSRTVTKAIAYG